MYYDRIDRIFAIFEIELEHDVIEKPKIKRPWGGYTILKKSSTSWIKKLFIQKGSRTSLQTHALRDEILVVLSGNVIVQVGNKKYRAKVNDVIIIPKHKKHRLTGIKDTCILEFAFGRTYERDIVRYEDDYGRA